MGVKFESATGLQLQLLLLLLFHYNGHNSKTTLVVVTDQRRPEVFDETRRMSLLSTSESEIING